MNYFERLIFIVLWGAAWTWLLHNPKAPNWFETAEAIKRLGGIPDL